MTNGQVRLTLGHDVTMVRHFRGLDDEISRETRLIPSSMLRKVQNLRDHKTLLARLRGSTTVRYGVEEIRLFNGDNHETTKFSFHSPYCTTKENEESLITENHDIRMEVIQALTDGTSTVATVSFIPGGVDHIQNTADVLPKCWQEELDTFCARLDNPVCRNSHLRHVHFETKLCTGWSLNIDQLLQSSLEEISLPDLREKGWRDFAAGLVWNRTLRVVTVRYDEKKLNTLLQTSSSIRQGEPISKSWTTCNQTMKTLCISLPDNFRADVQDDAEVMASTLCRVSSVSTFVIEYSPPERPPELLTFAKCLRQALVRATNVSVLHLLVPFRGQELREHILSVRGLTCLILVLDFWGKADLKAAKNMIRDNPKLEVFGLRVQDPKRKLSWKRRLLSQEITRADIVTFLGHDMFDKTSLRTLSLRGWDLVDGETVSVAMDKRLAAQPNLYIDLTGTGLLLKNKRAAHEELKVRPESERSTKSGLSSSHNTSQAVNNGSVYPSAISRMSGMPLSAGSSTSGSSFCDSRYAISEHVELGSHIEAGPGSVWAATPEHQPLPLQQQYHQQQPHSCCGELGSHIGEGPGSVYAVTTEHQQWHLQQLRHQQQQHPVRQQGSPMHFSKFSFDQLQEATGNFDPGAFISRGGFGQVYFGELTTPDNCRREVAVKDLNLEGVNGQRVMRSFETEVRTLGHLHHKNLVRLLGYCTHDRRHLLVYEFMPNLSLDRWIFRDSPQEFKLPWRTRVSIAVGVARGLTYLHIDCNQTIIHLDIKPQNILLDGQMIPKLADFGLAKLVVDTERNLATVTQVQGTERYMAPEIYQSNCVTPQSDVFSFGLLLIEILRGRRNSDKPQVDEDSYLTFPFWARKKFQNGQCMRAYEQLRASLVSPLIPGYQEKEAQRMLCIAIACINDDMIQRPDMRTVLHMLEGREPVPDPSQVDPP